VDTYVDQANPTTSYGAAAVLSEGGAIIPSPRTRSARTCGSTTSRRRSPRGRWSSAPTSTDGRGGEISGANSHWLYRTAPFSTGITFNTAGTPTQTREDQRPQLHAVGLHLGGGATRRLEPTRRSARWTDGSLGNYGLQFGSDQGGTNYEQRNFYSSDDATLANRPKLVVNYAIDNEIYAGNVGGQGYLLQRNVEVLRGASIIADTYIENDNPTTNFSSATSVDLKTRNAAPLPMRRGLLKVDMSNPVFAGVRRRAGSETARRVWSAPCCRSARSAPLRRS